MFLISPPRAARVYGTGAKAKTNLSALTRSDVQDLLKQIDLTGVEFSAIMGKSKNFVTDMKRFGVPFYVEIILRLAVELKTNGGDRKFYWQEGRRYTRRRCF